MKEANQIFGARDDLMLCETALEAATGVDALVIVTEWKEFQSPDFKSLKLLLKNPVIFDGRNIYDPKLLKELGINYFGIGRGDSIHIGDGEIPTLKGSK